MNAVFKSLYHHAVQKKVLLWITLLSAVILFFYSFGVTETFVQEHPKVLYVTSTSKLNGAELNSPRTNGYTISSVKSKDDGFRNIFGDESNFDKLDTISTKGNLSISNNLFDINSTDVIVDLHIQKTSGSAFGRHLVHDLKLVSKCKGLSKKIHRCLRPVGQDEGWLFSRFTTGWMCGVHAGWTSLTECVPEFYQDFDLKRRYFYITVLREPIARYLSELGHVQRGATWDQFNFICNHTKQPLDLCWNKDAENWSNVTLQ
uniref:Heparan-sulfate 6-O-sulfotransferase n=1 Tax=Ciona savignyi TaxID=51511 RepID=H2ZFL4_CIOSA